MLKKQSPTSLLHIYILHIDLIRIAMHNMYTHNGKPFHILIYILYIPWAYDHSPKAISQLNGDTKGHLYLQVHPRGLEECR